MKRFYSVLLVAAVVAFGSCKKNNGPEISEEKSFSNLVVPAGFDWKMSRDVQFNITVTDTRFTNMGSVISIYSADPGTNGVLLSKGVAYLGTPFKNKVDLANTITEVYVVKTAPDNTQFAIKVPVTSALVNVTMNENSGVVSSKNGSATISAAGGTNTSAEPTHPNCTRSITTSTSAGDVNNGEVVCITGNNISVSFGNVNGGVILVKGTGVTLDNLNLGNTSSLVIASTGTVTLSSNFNMNSNQCSVKNYGTVNSSAFGSNAPITNEGTWNVNGNFQHNNSASVTTNSGNFNVSGTMVINNGTFNNSKSTIINGYLDVSGSGVLNNTCYLWGKSYANLSKTVTNTGFIQIDGVTTVNNGGTVSMSGGAMFKTNELKLNGVTLTGSGATSAWKVTTSTTVDNNPTFSGTLQLCTTNTLANTFFTNGATQGCTVAQPSLSCNTTIVDTDGDGVADAQDVEPTNPLIAISAPGKTGTLAFEDKWPLKGDYDMNDVVISYSYTLICKRSVNCTERSEKDQSGLHTESNRR